MIKDDFVGSAMLKRFENVAGFVPALREELTQQRWKLRVDKKTHYAARKTK